jgi:radical SAM protein with 4Fe4S-binding SPASM domain
MDTNEWKQIITAYRTRGVRYVTFTGGEATLRDDLPEIMDYAYKLGFTVGLVTNGRAVTTKLLEFLQPRKVLLSISVPGIDTFKEHTGVDNIEHVLSLFDECKKNGVNTVANIAVTKKNLAELYENISIPILHGADYVLLNRFLPGGRGMENTDLLLTVDEINEMLDVAESVLERAGLNGHVGTELPYCIIKNPKKYERLKIASTCGAAKGFFVTDPAGGIKVCNHSPENLCNWREIDKLATNEYWLRFITRSYRPKMCDGCNYTDICDGGCREAAHVANGSVSANDPCFGIL